jgi:hypothetical protein
MERTSQIRTLSKGGKNNPKAKTAEKTVTMTIKVQVDAETLGRFNKLELKKILKEKYFSDCINDVLENILRYPDLPAWYVKSGAKDKEASK